MPDVAQSEEKQFPAVEVAYHFVLPSYQQMATRFESADTRLTTLLTLVSTGISILPAGSGPLYTNTPLRTPDFFIARCAAPC